MKQRRGREERSWGQYNKMCFIKSQRINKNITLKHTEPDMYTIIQGSVLQTIVFKHNIYRQKDKKIDICTYIIQILFISIIFNIVGDC